MITGERMYQSFWKRASDAQLDRGGPPLSIEPFSETASAIQQMWNNIANDAIRLGADKRDIFAHLSHCNIGEYKNSCKYGDESCPALGMT